VLFAVAATGATLAPTTQVGLGRAITARLDRIVALLDPIPEPLMGLALIGVAVGALVWSARGHRGSGSPSAPDTTDCHDTQDGHEHHDHAAHR
jgi:hypothetical protein